MNILATNDDGVTSAGLLALVKELKSIANLKILAPDQNRSVSRNTKTLDRPIRTKNIQLPDGTHAWTCDGTPSDCVSMAILGYFSEKFDLVVAGINPTENFGLDLTHSGIFSAALEAALWGITGIAFSLNSSSETSDHLYYASAAKAARSIVEKILEENLPSGLLLNVNIPNIPFDNIKGCKITHHGNSTYRNQLDLNIDPSGHTYYCISGDFQSKNTESGSEFQALNDGFISITPIKIGLKDYSYFQDIECLNWLDRNINNDHSNCGIAIEKWSMVFNNMLQTI